VDLYIHEHWSKRYRRVRVRWRHNDAARFRRCLPLFSNAVASFLCVT